MIYLSTRVRLMTDAILRRIAGTSIPRSVTTSENTWRGKLTFKQRRVFFFLHFWNIWFLWARLVVWIKCVYVLLNLRSLHRPWILEMVLFRLKRLILNWRLHWLWWVRPSHISERRTWVVEICRSKAVIFCLYFCGGCNVRKRAFTYIFLLISEHEIASIVCHFR